MSISIVLIVVAAIIIIVATGFIVFIAGMVKSTKEMKPISIEDIKVKNEKTLVSLKCPNCGSSLKNADEQKCEYCGQIIVKK